MTLIKSAHSKRLLQHAVVLDMGDLGQQAQRMLDVAREQADRITADATAKAQQLVDGADKKGYLEGLSRGRKEGHEAGLLEGRVQAIAEFRDRLEQLATGWTDAIALWEQERSQMLQEAREDVIRFAIDVTDKVVRRVVQSDPSVVTDQVVEALTLLARPTAVEIQVHPEDRAIVEELLPRMTTTVQACEHISISTAESISRGGCVVKTSGGKIDASLETQIARIAEALVPNVLP